MSKGGKIYTKLTEKFITDNRDLIKKGMDEVSETRGKFRVPWKTETVAKVLSKARAELGYSPSTIDYDIWYRIENFYKTLYANNN